MLIVVGGLPATGKSTLSVALARRLRTTYLRVDRIEHAVVAWSELDHPLGPVGYAVAHGLAEDQLGLGLDVVVECVNPSTISRYAWLATAEGAAAALVEVELVCSDAEDHRSRVQSRESDVVGLVKPTWEEVRSWAYEPWDRPHLVLDTSTTTVDVAVEQVLAEAERLRVA